jgi:DNA-binding winged helix-turn-helix (wHTH) protein/Tfp pilus assembly protein PilF
MPAEIDSELELNTAAERKKLVRFGAFEADLEQRILLKGGARVRLQDQPFQILASLLERPGEIVTREELRQRIWSADTYVEFDDGLNTAIKKLRLALGDAASNPLYVETIPRRGYRFVPPVEIEFEEIAEPLPHSSELLEATSEKAAAALDIESHNGLQSGSQVGGISHFRTWQYFLTAVVLLAVAAGSYKVIAAHRASSQLPVANSSKAQQDYTEGNYYWARRSDGGLLRAIQYFNRSVAEDPGFARSYAALANCYIVAPMYPGSPSQTEAFPKATESMRKALALDPGLPEAHLAAAEVALYIDWDFAKARQEFQRTLALNPDSLTGHQWYGEFLSLMGEHAQAIREDEMAIQLDPNSGIAHHQLANTYQAARQYDRAMVEYRQAIQLSPSYGLNYHSMMWLKRRQGKYGEALASMMSAVHLYGTDRVDLQTANQLMAAYAEGGRDALLKKEIDLTGVGTRPALYKARDYAVLGDKTMALYWLARAAQLHDNEALYINTDIEFDSMRADPEFQALVKSIGFH